MSDFEIVTNRVLLLGGGLAPESDNPERLRLSLASTERAESVLDYYHAHAAAFTGREAMIICSGGASAIYDGIDVNELAATQTEGALLADRLLQGGIPAGILEAEKRSTTTTLNVVNSIEGGFLNPKEYDSDNPLAIGTHIHHYRRARLDLRDAGFTPDSSINIHPAREDNAKKELVLRGIRTVFFMGVRPGDLQEMRKRNERMSKTFGRTK